jgi:O-antigen/teichoic acid export membrane protein
MFRNGFVIIVTLFFHELKYFFIWQTVSTLIFTLLIGTFLKLTLTERKLFYFKPKIEKDVLKSVRNFAGGMLLITVVASINSQIDKIFISKYLSIETLGYYTLAMSLSIGILVLVSPFSAALLPKFTSLYSLNRKNEASLLFQRFNLFISILVFSMTMIFLFFGKPIVWIWTGNAKLAENVNLFIPFVAFSAAMTAIATMPYSICIANGYTKLNNVLGILSLIITLPFYWVAIKYYGAIGAACVFCIIQTTITMVYVYFVNKKFIHVKNISNIYLTQIALPLFITLFISFIFSFIMPNEIAKYKFYSFLWIVVSFFFTFIGTTLILIPIKNIKYVFNLKSF